MRRLLLVLLTGLAAACAGRTPAGSAPPAAVAEHTDDELLARVDGAAQALGAGRVAESVRVLDEVIAHYEAQHVAPGVRNVCARSQPEMMVYLLMGAEEKQNTRAIARQWADAFYLRGYAAVEQKDLDAAERWLRRALDLSPKNALFLSELGHVAQLRRDWPAAMSAYRAAEEAAELSPESTKLGERTRAMRGVGFVLIEVGEFRAAQEIYEACLRLDPEDEKARQELEYVRQKLGEQD